MLFLIFIYVFIISLCSCTVGSPEQSNYTLTHVSLGMAYLQQGDRQKARLLLTDSLSKDPNSPTTLDAMAYLEETCGNLSKAESFYRQAIRKAPAVGEWHNNYGTFLCRNHKESQGIQEFLLAITDKNYLFAANAYENAGLCALKLNDQTGAKNFFSQALKNNPQLTVSREKLIAIVH